MENNSSMAELLAAFEKDFVVPKKREVVKGKVVSVGPGQYSAMGQLIEPTVKVGDIVIMPQMGPTVLNHRSDEYLVCKENEILAIIEE